MSSSKLACPEVNLMQDYLDQRLSLPDRILLEKHLKTCNQCSRDLESLKALFSELDSNLSPTSSDNPTPAQFDEHLSRLSRRQISSGGKWFVTRWFNLQQILIPTLAGIGVILMCLGALYWRSFHRPSGQGVTENKGQGLQVFSCVLLPQSSELLCIQRSRSTPPAKDGVEANSIYRLPLPNQAVLVNLEENRLEFSNQALFFVHASGTNLLSGRVYCDIREKGKPFMVTTPFGTVTSLGTKFGVDVHSEFAKVTLDQGKIMIRATNVVGGAGSASGTHSSEETMSSAGERFLLSKGQIQKEPPPTGSPVNKPQAPVSSDLPAGNPDGAPGSGAESLSHSF